MPVTQFIWGPSGSGLSERAWALAEETGAAWVGNNAAAHISLLRSTVAEELAVPMEQRGVSADQMRRAITEALDLWELPADQDPSTLSTGQTRRVAIAAALLAGPDALVLDCPVDGLDAQAMSTLRAALDRFPGEVTVFDRVWSPLADAAADAPMPHIPERPLAASAGPALIAQDVVVRRGRGGVGPINLTSNYGEVTHLAGPNGSGKTTLFLAALGLVEHEGKLRVPERLGWAPTAMDSVMTQKTVLQEVALGADRERAEAALEFAGVADVAGMHPLDVPSSQRRLVLVAAALVRAPELLLLDEPTVGLDAAGYGRLGEVMHGFAAGEFHRLIGCDGPAGVLWTCHDGSFAGAVSHASQEIEIS
ncbi:MAG TPA: ATP-binding cassette domain-containing protein [Candidatus Corynebacterium gallistercoris]|uniref:ATP-binding cassette domain-containing protein n=1 Tax=Candidatus Corynebacterium gallistercoris TaxID=2838530 RepID=A0A9D1RYR4_9CORY|nr:ATP-binding cassette domain-containing protein [Candidatus Corynebacterium gallistercoris]